MPKKTEPGLRGALKRIGKSALKGAGKGAKKHLLKKGKALLTRDVYANVQAMIHRWLTRTTSTLANDKGPAGVTPGGLIKQKDGSYDFDSRNPADYSGYRPQWDGKVPSVSHSLPQVPLVKAPASLNGSVIVGEKKADELITRVEQVLSLKTQSLMNRRVSYRHWLTAGISNVNAVEASGFARNMLAHIFLGRRGRKRRGWQIISTRKNKPYGKIQFGGRSGFRRRPGRPGRQEGWQQSDK